MTEQNLLIVRLDMEYKKLHSYFDFLVVESAMIVLFLIVYTLSRQVLNLYKDKQYSRYESS